MPPHILTGYGIPPQLTLTHRRGSVFFPPSPPSGSLYYWDMTVQTDQITSVDFSPANGNLFLNPQNTGVKFGPFTASLEPTAGGLFLRKLTVQFIMGFTANHNPDNPWVVEGRLSSQNGAIVYGSANLVGSDASAQSRLDLANYDATTSSWLGVFSNEVTGGGGGTGTPIYLAKGSRVVFWG